MFFIWTDVIFGKNSSFMRVNLFEICWFRYNLFTMSKFKFINNINSSMK